MVKKPPLLIEEEKCSCWLVFILLWCFHYMQELLWFHNCPSHLDSSKSSYISFILQFSELAGVMNVWARTSELIYSWESKLTHALLCFWYWTFLDCFWFNLVFSALVILASKSSLLSNWVQYLKSQCFLGYSIRRGWRLQKR